MLERRFEIGVHAGLEVVIAVVGVGAARLLGMGVDVDGHKLVEIYRSSSPKQAFRELYMSLAAKAIHPSPMPV